MDIEIHSYRRTFLLILLKSFQESVKSVKKNIYLLGESKPQRSSRAYLEAGIEGLQTTN